MSRLAERPGAYGFLAAFEARHGRFQTLQGRLPQDLPPQGVYVFMDPSAGSVEGFPRIVRVGTHGVSITSKATLRGRLRQHQGAMAGPTAGGGNHRGSVFRKHVGFALGTDGFRGMAAGTWGQGATAPALVREQELEHEQAVSQYLRSLPFAFAEVSGAPDLRLSLERRLIAELAVLTLENPPKGSWLGWRSPNPTIVSAGLWNVHGVP